MWWSIFTTFFKEHNNVRIQNVERTLRIYFFKKAHNQLKRKTGKNLKQKFHKHMKRLSSSLIIMEIVARTTGKHLSCLPVEEKWKSLTAATSNRKHEQWSLGGNVKWCRQFHRRASCGDLILSMGITANNDVVHTWKLLRKQISDVLTTKKKW